MVFLAYVGIVAALRVALRLPRWTSKARVETSSERGMLPLPSVLALDSYIRKKVEKEMRKEKKKIVFIRSVFSFASYSRSHQTKEQERKLQILFKKQRKEINSNNNRKKT